MSNIENLFTNFLRILINIYFCLLHGKLTSKFNKTFKIYHKIRFQDYDKSFSAENYKKKI